MNTAARNLDRVKIVVYSKSLVKPPVMAALVQQLEIQKGRLESEVIAIPAAILRSVEQTSLTVLIVSLQAKEELLEVLNVLTQVEARTQSGLLRVLVLNGLNHPRVMALLKAKGVTDIVDFNVTIKALNHKLKNALLLVTQTYQRLHNQSVQTSAVLGNEARGGANARNAQSSNEVTWLKPTDHLSDFWWVPSARNLRFVMGRWLADILGPGPSAGFWEEATHERQGEKGWEWRIRVPTDPTFQPRSGRWLFFGKQPEFIWQKNLWSFVSKFPYLAFYAEGESEPEFVRIQSPALGKVKIFENSEISRQYLPKIQASLEASLKLSKSEANGDPRGGSRGQENAATPGNYSTSAAPNPEPRGPAYSQGDLSPDAPAGEWNNHESPVGANFKPKDIRIDESKAKTKWRNSLTPDSSAVGKLGMKDVAQAGITSGARSFDKLSMNVTLLLRNGQPMVFKDPLRVMEVTADGATFEFPRDWIVEQDKFTLRVEFHLGDVEKIFEIEWSSRSAHFIEGAGCLAHGEFTGGALDELAAILALIQQREVELRGFFIVAKGA